MATYILGFLFPTAALATVLAFLRLRKLHAEHDALSRTHEELVDRFRAVVDVDAERRRVLGEIEEARAALQAESARARAEHEQERRRVVESAEVRAELRSLDEEANLQSFGFYKPHYDFASSDKYQRRLEVIREQQCSITREYLGLRLNELYLAHEYQEKLQEEKEEQRRIREQMREEEVAQRELEKARQEAENEEKRYAAALAKAQEAAERAAGAKQQKLLTEIEELQRRLAEAQANKQRAIARAQLTRSGHVCELGDASVPFLFDVHAMIWTEDAPALESALHRTFHHRRVNRVNERKEFFRITLAEIVEVVRTNHAAEIEFVSFAEAAEYRQTLALTGEERPTPGPARVAETAMA